MNNEIYISVSALNRLIKNKFDSDPSFNDVFLKGELSNVKLYPSGHLYFAIKDSESIIKGVMWASYTNRLDFVPKDGDEIVLHGKVTTYPARGEYQIYVDAMALAGQGDELRKLKELTEKLLKEGLFDESKKRSIPKFPKTVGLITAKGSAAIEDMKVNLRNRWPLIEILEFPALVQGKDAPKDLIRAFNESQKADVDVLIIGRGGGSSEDLGAFNDEELVRALATSKCPTISAVGHEIDVTLTDLVADKRVSTPTGAAVAAVPDKNEIMEDIDTLYSRIESKICYQYETYKRKLDSLCEKQFLNKPSVIYSQKIDNLNALIKQLSLNIANTINLNREKIKGVEMRLKALSPTNVITRGYSITTDDKGNVIKDALKLSIGTNIKTRLRNGIITSTIVDKEEK